MTYQELLSLPLSAYTPGQGDPRMEGGFETATGAPMFQLEDYIKGKVPYVTGATSDRSLFGQTVNRKIGDVTVPVKLTDYGPGVKGIDVATSNSAWATNFPYQGATDTYGSMASASAIAPRQGSGQMSTWQDYNNVLTADQNRQQVGSVVSPIVNAIGSFGKGMQQQGEQGGAQAMAMLQNRSPAAALLKQLADNPTAFLQQANYFGGFG